MTQPSRRSILATALFALLIIGSFRPQLLRLILPPHRMPSVPGPVSGLDRRPLRLRDDGTPEELRRFLATARTQIERGRSVAVVLPPPFDGWSYAYWRAVYELAGRNVLLPGSTEDADYVVTWNAGGGTVMKRR